jgi:hypothetical protein
MPRELQDRAFPEAGSLLSQGERSAVADAHRKTECRIDVAMRQHDAEELVRPGPRQTASAGWKLGNQIGRDGGRDQPGLFQKFFTFSERQTANLLDRHLKGDARTAGIGSRFGARNVQQGRCPDGGSCLLCLDAGGG